jgi:predicted kinase
MLTAYILRGLPGSGKSHLAKILQPDASHVHNTDKYFVNFEGVYAFEATKLGRNHELNKAAFKKDCENKVEVVVLDNTNTQQWEYADYALTAIEHGYTIQYITVGFPKTKAEVAKCFARQSHAVPLASLQKMSDRFEL